ncbi:MAG: UDP-N-acetylmuramate dehydrogenase [Spirochaetaceae bacterium]|nr:MAG: UDP-N-acetylmuramate dehydrogenase [Spirochaetaceae bacterium]
MSRHTSFRIGGPADLYLKPATPEQAARIYRVLNREKVPTFILGAGANILVSDLGIRGAVIDMSGLKGCTVSPTDRGAYVEALAGTAMSEVSELALENGLSGLEFIYSMPGSVGGSVWMNARCYGHSISEVLLRVRHVEPSGRILTMEVVQEQFSYKRSPFQSSASLILGATFDLKPGDRRPMQERMRWIKQDREQKGHYLYPCAGSIFKNDRAFGNPTGKLIDSLGLKGRCIGEACVSQLHGNIIVNTGSASAIEVLKLIRLLEREVQGAFGFRLEREILLVGQWQEEAI